MIYFFMGVPGAGKSLHLAKCIFNQLAKGYNVICCNLKLDEKEIERLKEVRKIKNDLGTLVCVPKYDLIDNAFVFPEDTPKKQIKYSYIEGLYGFAENFHKRNEKGQFIEGQTLLVIDECEDFYDSRTWNNPDRLKWVEFFRMHRHYGFDCILCSQTDNGIDKKIRAVLQTKVDHRDYINYKGFWKMFAKLNGGHLFLCNEYLYAIKKRSDSFIRTYFNNDYKDFYNIYDSFETVQHIEGKTYDIKEECENDEEHEKNEYWNECINELNMGVYMLHPELCEGL